MTELSVWTLLNPFLILCSKFYSLMFKLCSWIKFCFSNIYSTSSCCHSGFCLIIHKTIRHTQRQRRQPFVYLAEVTLRTSSASLVPVQHLNDITLTTSSCFSVFCLTLQRLFITWRSAPSPALEQGNFWIKWYAPTATEATCLAAPNKTPWAIFEDVKGSWAIRVARKVAAVEKKKVCYPSEVKVNNAVLIFGWKMEKKSHVYTMMTTKYGQCFWTTLNI